MLYLIIHLQREEYEEDLLLAMASAGVFDAVVSDCRSARETMAHALPIFAGFSADLSGGSTYAKLIAASISEEKVVDDLMEELKEADIDFQEEGVGSMFVLPGSRYAEPAL